LKLKDFSVIIINMKVKIFVIFMIIITAKILEPKAKESNSYVNWQEGVVVSMAEASVKLNEEGEVLYGDSTEKTSIANGRDIAYLKAKELAIEKAFLAIDEIPVDSNTTVGQLMESDRDIREKIYLYMNDYAKFREMPAGYLKERCRLELKLGYIIDALNIDFPEEPFPLRADRDIATRYTSLIIDTRGLKIKPLLIPSVFQEDGLEIYGKNKVNGKAAVKNLIISYTHSEAEALKHKKAGRRPFFCTALKSLNGNPVISKEDVKRILSHNDNISYLKKCKVILIIDR